MEMRSGVDEDGHGVILTLLSSRLRHLGTARTGAYFSTAPFVGAALSLFVLRSWTHWSFATILGDTPRCRTERRGRHQHVHGLSDHAVKYVTSLKGYGRRIQ